jgi:hypothetical protein
MKCGKRIVLIMGFALVVLAPPPARAQNVFAASNWNTVHIPATVVRLLLPNSGTYVVNAKVTVHNLDSDPQPAVCRIIATPGFPANPPNSSFAIDRAMVRIDHRDGGDQQSIALQGVVSFAFLPAGPGGGQVSLVCETPNGTASDMVITAIQNTGTFNTPPCTNPLFCNTYTLPPK